ncbi:MAG: hypothetical protein FJW81_02565 [Actinobacteria bacterium]|nr:hypothetical protein [Actinomycetota bacterium]
MYSSSTPTVLGHSTDPASDRAVADRATALARECGTGRVRMVAPGGIPAAIGDGLGPELLPGESGHDAEGRAAAMSATAQAAGLAAVAQAVTGPDGATLTAICERYDPDAAVIGLAYHRLLGDLWDFEAVRAGKPACADLEVLHA